MKRHLLLGVGLFFVGLLFLGLLQSWRRDAIVTTPLPDLAPEAPLRVGPLVLSENAVLVIVTPELHARINDTGAARLFRHDPNRLPGQEPMEISVELGPTGWNDLLVGLGQIRVAWTTRLVGESAERKGAEPAAADPERIILIKEETPDGASRIIMQLRPDDPEYEELRRILTPLRVGQ